MEDLQADPTAMRARATTMQRHAESLRNLGQRLDRRIEALRFEGPAATRFRAGMAERSQRARGAAHRLDEVADRIQSEAARLEQHADRRITGA
jgi:WXG100 family type VII secretion target